MKKLLSIAQASAPVDLGLLVLRVGASIFMIHHGYGKIQHFPEIQEKFMNFLGFSGSISLCLTIFAEFFCSILLLTGLLSRLAVIPLMITMAVAAVMAHEGDFFGKGEPATIYLIIYTTLLVTGPGRYSLDKVLFK
ncbi:MAG: DoxX family protein [Bacteroidetes bacterium]|nr:DoxX family protein [Bacteroidota bacterium]